LEKRKRKREREKKRKPMLDGKERERK